MPIQGGRSKDDILLELNDKELSADGPDPEKVDRVILLRHRVSRILFLRRFFDYPISLSMSTLSNMGIIRTIRAGFGYLLALMYKKEEKYDKRIELYRAGIKQWDTSVSVTMILRGQKQFS